MISCPACSAKNSAASKFCSECGSALKSDYEATMTYSSMQPSEDSSTSSDSSIHGRFLPGTKLVNRYRIVSLLGKGGMGEVYRADDLRLGHTVALKFLPRHVSKDPKRLECFHSEVRLSRQISHPNVCRVYDIGDVDGHHFLSMEYIDGEDLRILLRRIGRIQKDKGIQLARQLCAGLAAAHEKGVLHRDLKPANIMIDGRGQVRITDFGLAQLASEGEREIAGTPAYMAPEQITRGETSIQSDLYSLGLILYEMFTGERVHKPDSFAQLRELHLESSSAKRPSEVVDDIEPAVERVIMQCLEREPQERPKSVTVVAASLPGGDPLAAAIAAGETPSPELVAASGETGRLSPLVAGLCLAGVAAGLLVGMFAQKNSFPLERAPAVLEDEAKEIIRHLGYVDPPTDTAYGFMQLNRELDYVERRMEQKVTLNGWEVLKSGPWPGVRFWYRQHTQEMFPDIFWDGTKRGRSRVTPTDPPFMWSGMVGVRLHPRGQLRWFRAVPPRTTVPEDDATHSEPRWSEWFAERYLGFSLDDLSPTAWRRTPPDAYDSVQAWEGIWPGTSDPLYVVAAAYRGRPVYFEVLRPPRKRQKAAAPAQSSKQGLDGMTVIAWMLTIAQAGAVILAWRNLRLGRGNRRGALRIAAYFLLVEMLVWLLKASHCRGLAEYAIFQVGFASACGSAAFIWVFYIALEPYVRRLWPEVLVSWTRLLDGRFRDPRVGRDLLVGALVGTLGPKLMIGTSWFFSFGRPSILAPDCLMGPAVLVGDILDAHLSATMLSLAGLVVLLLLRILFRSKRLAALCLVIIYVAIFTNAGHMLATDRASRIIFLAFCLVVVAVFVFILIRFGLLSLVAAYSASNVLAIVPITTDTSAFYFGNGLFAIALVAAIALYGYYTSLGGKAAFGDVVLDRNR